MDKSKVVLSTALVIASTVIAYGFFRSHSLNPPSPTGSFDGYSPCLNPPPPTGSSDGYSPCLNPPPPTRRRSDGYFDAPLTDQNFLNEIIRISKSSTDAVKNISVVMKGGFYSNAYFIINSFAEVNDFCKSYYGFDYFSPRPYDVPTLYVAAELADGRYRFVNDMQVIIKKKAAEPSGEDFDFSYAQQPPDDPNAADIYIRIPNPFKDGLKLGEYVELIR